MENKGEIIKINIKKTNESKFYPRFRNESKISIFLPSLILINVKLTFEDYE